MRPLDRTAFPPLRERDANDAVTDTSAPMDEAPGLDLSVIIVTFNSAGHIAQCLDAIEHTARTLSCEVIVSDNGSVDSTAEIVRSRYPRVILLENRANLGFGRANNRGLQASSGRFILFLNDDTVVKEGALPTLVNFIRGDASVGGVGARLLNTDGTLQRSILRDPSIVMDWLRIIAPRGLEPDAGQSGRIAVWFARLLGVSALGRFTDHESVVEVPCVVGACLLVRREVLQDVGGFDEQIFLWCEENDLCLRIRRAGWRIMYVPAARVVHTGGRVLGRPRDPMPRRVTVQKLQSNLYFFEKHRPRLEVWLYRLGLLSLLGPRWLCLSLRIALSGGQRRRIALGNRELTGRMICVLCDDEYRKRNVFTEMIFKHVP